MTPEWQEFITRWPWLAQVALWMGLARLLVKLVLKRWWP